MALNEIGVQTRLLIIPTWLLSKNRPYLMPEKGPSSRSCQFLDLNTTEGDWNNNYMTVFDPSYKVFKDAKIPLHEQGQMCGLVTCADFDPVRRRHGLISARQRRLNWCRRSGLTVARFPIGSSRSRLILVQQSHNFRSGKPCKKRLICFSHRTWLSLVQQRAGYY